jgi:hypothetical protein
VIKIKKGKIKLEDNINYLSIIGIADYIQDIVADVNKYVGPGATSRQRTRARSIIMLRVSDSAHYFSDSMKIRGDHNLFHMFGVSFVSAIWYAFILKAKSIDTRRPEKDRKEMSKSLKEYKKALIKAIDFAIEYGSVYDKMNGKDRVDMEKNPISDIFLKSEGEIRLS